MDSQGDKNGKNLGSYDSQGGGWGGWGEFLGSRKFIICRERLLVSRVYHLYEHKQKLQTEPAVPGTE